MIPAGKQLINLGARALCRITKQPVIHFSGGHVDVNSYTYSQLRCVLRLEINYKRHE